MARLNLVFAQKDEKTGLLSEVTYDVLTQTDFIEKYHPSLRLTNLTYLFKSGKIDYFELGTNKYVVMTEKTRTYVPNNSSRRRGK